MRSENSPHDVSASDFKKLSKKSTGPNREEVGFASVHLVLATSVAQQMNPGAFRRLSRSIKNYDNQMAAELDAKIDLHERQLEILKKFNVDYLISTRDARFQGTTTRE